jgi:DNA-binding NarL/FixJ family response regulator
MEEIDLSAPHQVPAVPGADSAEVERLQAAFRRMIARLEVERRDAGRAAIRAQERERRRIAQDLHDEVNQALTAVSLRLQASIEHAPLALRRELTETKRLSAQAMEELLALARQLRPAVLDDHGLLPALHSQVRDFAEQTGIRASFHPRGTVPRLSPEQQLVIYRVTQESLSNVAQHAMARKVEVELSFIGRTVLGVAQRWARFVGDERAGAARRRAAVDLVRRGAGHAGGADDRFMSTRILIADDHGIVRAGIRLLLENQPDLDVVAEAADGVEAIEQALAARPDLCILDVGMPRMTGLQAARAIRSHIPDSRVLMLSMHDDEHYLFEALKAGASGYVLKREADQDLVGAVRAVGRGEAFLTNAAERSIIRQWMADGAQGPVVALTPREEEVVKLIAEAHTNAQIAEILHVSEKTVESHRANVLRKLGMRDRVELVRYAIRRGLVEP